MESENQAAEKVAVVDMIVPPMKNTYSLEIPPEKTSLSDIARKQLENLNKNERKPRRKAESSPISETETYTIQSDTPTIIIQQESTCGVPKQMHNLTSAIVSKAELEDEIRRKVQKQETSRKTGGAIEIPHELIMSGLHATPSENIGDDAVQLHDQELIDILEGKSGDETEVFEVVHEEGRMVLVKDSNHDSGTSYEIISDPKGSEVKAKLLEREIAMRQIASLPVRKNRRSAASTSQQSIAQSLAADWTDDDKEEEMILEVVNMEDAKGEPKIKILNMTILNESPEMKPKVTRMPVELPTKILNKEAPKGAPIILNINASSAETPATFKRSRVIKKKEIWDPSEPKLLPFVEKKTVEKVPLSLPASITIKKLTKESISKVAADAAPKPIAKRIKKRSEIDNLLQDEGAVNMIYSLERENNNEDVPEIDVKPDLKSLVDKSEEKTSLVTKVKAIKNVVMKKSTSPSEVKPPGRGRPKKDKEAPVVAAAAESTTPVVSKAAKAPATAGRKKKADNSWDYIYSQAQATCDDAMIIRRHSNSSYSSSAASPRRLSVDVNESFESPPASAKKMKQESNEAFEFMKPPQKNTKSPADKLLNKDFVEELRGKISNVITKNKEKPATVKPAVVKSQTVKPQATKGRKRAATQPAESSTPAKRASERRSNGSDKEYRLVKAGNVAHIILGQNPLSIPLLSEMKALLNQLETDDCQVVLITSSEGFSEGLDYSTLVQAKVDRRKQAASDLVTAFK